MRAQTRTREVHRQARDHRDLPRRDRLGRAQRVKAAEVQPDRRLTAVRLDETAAPCLQQPPLFVRVVAPAVRDEGLLARGRGQRTT